MSEIKLYPDLKQNLDELQKVVIPSERKEILQPLIDFIQIKKNAGEEILLNFICTHNSRRSQLAEVWAKAISEFYGVRTTCFSGGTEATAFFKNAIDALERAGFHIKRNFGENPVIKISFSENLPSLKCYSKIYDAVENPAKNFAAVMTCSHADENCPFIPGAEARIALDYKDPKEYDNTAVANEKYDERSDQIASEMIYVFQNIK